MPLHPKAREFAKSGLFTGVKSFADLEKRIAAIPENKGKGDAFEQFVKAFLLLDPEYATKISDVWIHHEVPSAIRKKLHLPDSDQGIDLIAKTKEGEFWAIQCKYRTDSTRPIPWREISTFTGLAFGVCKRISFGLICSTTERITKVIGKQDRIGFCALDVWQGLDAEFFKRLRALLEQKNAKLKPLSPRPHQVAAVRDARKHFVTGKEKRGKLIMPCGTGKSLTAYWIAKELGSRRIVIAVPSLALIRQTLKVWLREAMAAGKEVEWICVCSDDSAGRFGSDDVSVLRQDLGIPCLTNPKEIAGWLKKKIKGLQVVFTTYQSGQALSAAARKANFRFDLGIMDEAHKTVGDGEKLFSHLLHDKNLPVDRRVFMTATERRYQGRGEKILSMEDPAIYGETFHLLSFKAALEQKPPILCDYRIVTIMVSREEVSEMVRKNAFVRPKKGPWDREMESEMLASLVALRKAMQKYPIRHAVSFHGSIRKAEHFAEQNLAFNKAFRSFGHVDTFHVSGATATGTRSKLIKEFAEKKRALITNARCLTEGVDVPDIDCVLFADPRRSAVDIVQAVGRALRPSPGKKMGYVIVPILHDAKAKPEKILESEDFQEILSTLRALASNDDRIIEYFRAIANGKKRPTGGSVTFDIDERIAKKIDLDQFIKDIDLKCWHRLAKLSWRPFEEAREFAHSLNLKKQKDWFSFCKGRFPSKGVLHPDIPTAPVRHYAKAGWVSWGDWLGTGNIATIYRKYRPFHEARAFARSLDLKTGEEWVAFTQGGLSKKGELPEDIPGYPAKVYFMKGWKGIGDWLGTGRIANYNKKYRPFIEARAFARGLQLKTGKEWRAFCKGERPEKGVLPSGIPSQPIRTYKTRGWKGMGDWLGTGRIANYNKKYRPFVQARAFARSLKLRTGDEWVAFCRGEFPDKGMLPLDIPARPRGPYKNKGWIGYGDWLGTGTIAFWKREYRPFEEARSFARSLNLKSHSQWIDFCQDKLPKLGKLPKDIPSNPQNTYKHKGWKGVGDWLGTDSIATTKRVFRPFRKARAFARRLGLKTGTEWYSFCRGELPKKGKLPRDIPNSPLNTYRKSGWISMGDWLGTDSIATTKRVFRPFRKARAFVRKLGLRNQKEWRQLCTSNSLPVDIPTNPQRTYEHAGWSGFGDWIGTRNPPRKKKSS
jgi:superfamily II DNA or RNA helicase